LSFVSPRNVAFKYRLAGLDRDWVEAGARRAAYYTRLPPGHYRFEVMACNNDGVWSQEAAALALTVLPHFWQTGWFLGGAALAALGAAGETARRVARHRMRQHREALERMQAVERERIRIAQDMHDDLGSRLTRIAQLGTFTMRDSQSFEEMKSHLGSLTDHIRGLINAMDEVVWTVRPENDSLPNLAAFVSDYTERFLAQTGVSHRLELDPEFPEQPVAAPARHNLLLAVKEALNNAVRHGPPKIIRLKIHARDGWLEVVIADDGHGFDVSQARARGHGLANVAERMTRIQGSAQFASELGKGTTVTLRLPLAGLQARD